MKNYWKFYLNLKKLIVIGFVKSCGDQLYIGYNCLSPSDILSINTYHLLFIFCHLKKKFMAMGVLIEALQNIFEC